MRVYVARIEGGLVAQVTANPVGHRSEEPEALIGPENIVGVGWAYDEGEFHPSQTVE